MLDPRSLLQLLSKLANLLVPLHHLHFAKDSIFTICTINDAISVIIGGIIFNGVADIPAIRFRCTGCSASVAWRKLAIFRLPRLLLPLSLAHLVALNRMVSADAGRRAFTPEVPREPWIINYSR